MFLTVFFWLVRSLDFCFQKLKSATVPFHEAETDNNKKKEACVLKCAILYKKHAELLVMRTQSRCLPPFICSDRVPHCNNLHKRKTQVTGVCVFYQMRLTPQTHLYICWSISFLWMSCSLNMLMQESILSLPSCRPTSGRHNRWSGCILLSTRGRVYFYCTVETQDFRFAS